MMTTLTLGKKRYVVIPEAEYRRLVDREPKLPVANEDGTLPAVMAARVGISRTIIRRRKKAGLNQAALAEKAGIRVETLVGLSVGR